MEHNGKIALIPAYNPDKKMLGVVEKLKEHGYTVVIVDDGSEGEFMDYFRQAEGADQILHHRRNMGKGVALKTGLKFIRDNFKAPYTVVTVDADGQHTITDTLTVTRAAQSNPDALIIGSRKLGKEAPYRSRSGNFITRTMLHVLTPVKVYDTQSGLRAFSESLVPVMCDIEGERYEYEMRVLIDINDLGIPIKEVRIKAVYIDSNSSSHFETVRDSKRIYKVIFKRAGKRRKRIASD